MAKACFEMNIPPSKITKFRWKLLKKETPAEKKAFEILTSYGLTVEKQKVWQGVDRRKFILDFYITQYWLGIEIDGGIHKERIDKDIERDLSLMGRGGMLYILRFTNDDIFFRPDYFVKIVYETILQRIKYLAAFETGQNVLIKYSEKDDHYLAKELMKRNWDKRGGLLYIDRLGNDYVFNLDKANDVIIGKFKGHHRMNQIEYLASKYGQ